MGRMIPDSSRPDWRCTILDSVADGVFTVDLATQITAALPPHVAGAVTVTVTTPGGSDTDTFTYLPLTDLEATIRSQAGPH